MKQKISRLALTEAGLTLLWVILMIGSQIINGPIATLEDAIRSVQNINFLHILTYLNAAALTAVAVLLYFAFYQYLKSDHPILSALGLVFVPVYGIFNLLVYFSQITIVPALATRNTIGLAQWLQIWPQSTIATLNQVAYALLGLSSILFGIAFLRKDSSTRLAAIFLILNGIACILGLIGVLIGNSLLGMGSLVGGVLFLVAVAMLGFQYRREQE
jgi:hypothetical protein